ncbi:MAG: DUF1189 family protein [Tatlockia sp.]|nr:DUF1189 family protein [Tatlockia sp.]
MIEEGKTLRNIDKPYYRYWQALYRSFFDSALYVDVAKRWKGFGLIYLLVLLFIASLPFSLRVIYEYNKFFTEEVVQPMLGLPTLYMQNGKISVDKPMPYFVKNPKGQIVAIVDTTGAITSMDKTYPNLTILVTKDKLFLRYPMPHFFFSQDAPQIGNDIQVYPLSSQGNSIFEGKDWVKTSGILNLKIFFGALLYPTIALTAFGIFLVLILAFTLMAQFIAKLFFKISLSYKQACRLFIVSATPFMWLFWTGLTLGFLYSGYMVVAPLIMIIYFCFAVLAVKRESHKLVRS